MLTLVLLAVALLGASAGIALLAGRSDRAALVVGTIGCLCGCALGLGAALAALLGGKESSLRRVGQLPLGELHVGLDALSSFFLVCIFLVSGLAALYGSGVLRADIGRRRLAPAAFFFNLLVASMAIVAVAKDGILFLIAWEVMSLASFFLVTYEDEREEVRRAGMTYLIASQLGVVFLFVLFGLLGRGTGNYDFDAFAGGLPAAGLATSGFWLALIGFGTKAGFWPVHIWLPDAHPAAPSHVSALMSGVMIKMGIYGLLRTLTFLGPPRAWWGATLIGVGAISGLTGILHALAQRDLKRRLAYSSVENIGIIALGIGLGLLGRSQGRPAVAVLGTAGALLHVLNHGLLKGLLFQGAGSVLHATSTRDLDALGGLSRRMPTTAATFLLASAGLSALPPLNGFVGEWLIYVGAFQGSASLPVVWAVSALLAIVALALVGGIAAACFVSAFGGAFLGQPRTELAASAHEAGPVMRTTMVAGALVCVAIGLWPAGAVRLVAPAAALVVRTPPAALEGAGSLLAISRVAAVLLSLLALLALARWALLRRHPARQASTWGCGYAAPSPRMQYTSTSFAEPLLSPFAQLMPTRVTREGPSGAFPSAARYEEHALDLAGERLLVPGTRRVIRALSRLRVLQQGRVQLYLVYIAVTLVLLLFWELTRVGR